MMRLRRIAMFYLALLPASVFADAQDLAMGSSVERHLPGDEQFMQWTRDAERLATQQGDEMAMREVVVPTPETIKLQNVVPPIHFESGVAEVPDSTIANLRAALESVRDKQNVRLHLVGHADNQPLSARLARRLRRQRRSVARTRGPGGGAVPENAGTPAGGDLVRVGRRQQADRRQRDRRGSCAEPSRRGRGLVRRDEGHDGDRRGARQERHPAGEGVPGRDRVQDALPRRPSAPRARTQSRGAAALRRSVGRRDAGVRRAGSAHARAPRRQTTRRSSNSSATPTTPHSHRAKSASTAIRRRCRRRAPAASRWRFRNNCSCRANRSTARATAPTARSPPTTRSRGGR